MNWHRKAMWIALIGALLAGGCGGAEPTLSELAAQGREIAFSRGCVSCHGGDGEGTVAPGWQGLYQSEVELEDGRTVTADAEYLRRSIVDPEADVVVGVTITMPTTSLTKAEVDALVEYIKELE